jgi:signal transduction histidine kinase
VTKAGLDVADDAGADDRVKRELARELHDQVVQDLTAMLIDLENFKRAPFDSQSTVTQVDSVQGSLRTMLGRLRGMLYGLRGEDTWEAEFAETLRIFAVEYKARTGMQVLIRAGNGWPDPIRRTAAQHIARIVQESVANARQHGRAGSVQVSLRLTRPAFAVVAIRDDGVGMPQGGGLRDGGMGILGMRERALLLGGTLSVDSAPGRGTTVRVTLPRASLDGMDQSGPPAREPSPQLQ